MKLAVQSRLLLTLGAILFASLSLAPTVRAQSPAQAPQGQVVAQGIDVGTPTQGGSNYLGIGGNIGISGNTTDVSQGGFSVVSKLGLASNLSLRPSVTFNRDAVIVVPITYDFRTRDVADSSLAVSPYIGGGAAFTTGSRTEVAPVVTAGVDVPLDARVTATAAVNAGFFNGGTDVGILLGVGYTFPNF